MVRAVKTLLLGLWAGVAMLGLARGGSAGRVDPEMLLKPAYYAEGDVAEQPDRTPFLCHRTYDLTRLRASGLKVPSTPLSTGLKEHVRSLLR